MDNAYQPKKNRTKYPDAPEIKFEDALIFEKSVDLALKRVERTQAKEER